MIVYQISKTLVAQNQKKFKNVLKKMNQISLSNVPWKLLTIENSSYHPYQTENNQIKYINIESNHPPSIIKQLQLSIKSRLSSLFSSEETFNDSVKIVYSCTRNIKTMINSHNAKILFPEKCTEQRTSNFSNKVNCPLEQKYLTRNIVCKAKVTSHNQNYQEKVYFGSCETTFKKRFSNHKKWFNLNEYKNETELSKEIWRLKDSSHYPKVKWEIVKKGVLYNPQTKRCLLCLNKKFEIAATKIRTY